MNNYMSFQEWKEFQTAAEDPTDNPFDKQPLGAEPVFLYTSNTSPLPAASMFGRWTAYPTSQKMAAHLRFGLLPAEFSIWLCRREWDPAADEAQTIETKP